LYSTIESLALRTRSLGDLFVPWVNLRGLLVRFGLRRPRSIFMIGLIGLADAAEKSAWKGGVSRRSESVVR